jgi:ribosomal protein S18 acetylase RimI-like enzyme
VAGTVRSYEAALDEAWATGFLEEWLGGRRQARRGELHDVLAPGLGLVAEADGDRVGLLTWRRDGPDGAELSALAAAVRGTGIGTELLEAVWPRLRDEGVRRVWVVTTNDNTDALRFYQRRGFRLAALRPGAVDAARRDLKPEIGNVGALGIPLRDELELERDVPDARARR